MINKDVYEQLIENKVAIVDYSNDDEDVSDTLLDYDQAEVDLEEELELEEPITKKPTRKNGEMVDADGQTYEDYLRSMGVEPPSEDGHYVNNAELYEHMVAYCDARDKAMAEGKEKPPVDNFIGEAIMKIATHLSFRPNFIGYSYRMDMIGDAIDNCLTYIDSFDPKKSKNPFSYLTQVCWCAFIRRLKLEKRQSVIRGKYMMMSNVTDTMNLDNDQDGDNVINNSGSIHRYMELAQEEEDKIKAEKAEKKRLREQAKEAARKKTALEEMFTE